MVIESPYNPLIDIFVYSYHLTAWYCIDIVSKNYVLVIHGSLRVKQSLKQTFRHSASQSIRLTIYVYLSHGPSSYNFLYTYLIGTIWHNNNKLRVTFLNPPPLQSKTKVYKSQYLEKKIQSDNRAGYLEFLSCATCASNCCTFFLEVRIFCPGVNVWSLPSNPLSTFWRKRRSWCQT